MKMQSNTKFSFFFRMKFFFIFYLFIFSFSSLAQDEIIQPIYRTSELKSNKRKLNDTLFIYTTDTLTLPFIDDFSENHFQKYTKNTAGINVKKTLFYKYLISNSLKVNLNKFSSSLPIKYIHSIQTKKDSIVQIKVPEVKLKVADFSLYPVKYSDLIVYPNFKVYDTIDKVDIPDTIWYKNQEFFQDSLLVFESKIDDKNAYWLDSNVYINDHFPINPWTIGVATFDGLNSEGYPYFINSSIRGYGDYLTSKPFDLAGLKLSDSVYFSFLYQPKGYGDAPENINIGSTSKHDSLCLQFFNPTYNKWFSVWSETVSDDPIIRNKQFINFKKVHFRIKDSTFLKKNFQFRFVNYGDLSGSLDHFHLDYVKFRKNSGYQDTLFKDFAFVYPIKSILKKYHSVPWKHFVNVPNKPINDSILFTIRNGSNIDENNDQNGSLILFKNGKEFNKFNIAGQTLTNGQVNYSKFTFYSSFVNFKDKINIPFNGEDSMSVNIKATINASFKNLPENDTSDYNQHFADYYSYDDGSAEAGYGLKSAQSSVAYKYKSLISDSILGAYIYFLPSVIDNKQKQFALTIWKDNKGVPGEIIYEDDDFSLHSPVYGKTRDDFKPYYLKDFKRILLDTSFFIGIRQIDKDPINIGFDRNTKTIDQIFYSLDKNTWKKSQVDTVGSLMIRPIFVSNINKKVYIENNLPNPDFLVYPNPLKNRLYILSTESNFRISDIQGREVLNFYNKEEGEDISDITPGVYFITEMKTGASQKIIIE